jgi:hypothetical protein
LGPNSALLPERFDRIVVELFIRAFGRAASHSDHCRSFGAALSMTNASQRRKMVRKCFLTYPRYLQPNRGLVLRTAIIVAQVLDMPEGPMAAKKSPDAGRRLILPCTCGLNRGRTQPRIAARARTSSASCRVLSAERSGRAQGRISPT